MERLVQNKKYIEKSYKYILKEIKALLILCKNKKRKENTIIYNFKTLFEQESLLKGYG